MDTRHTASTSKIFEGFLNSSKSLIGYYPNVVALKGSLVTGMLDEVKKNGFFDLVINKAGDLALKSDNGMCSFYIGAKRYLLITRPEHIKQVLINNATKSDRSGALDETFAQALFGEGNAFTLPSGEMHSQMRNVYQSAFSAPTKYFSDIQKVIADHSKKITPDTDIDLNHYFSRLAIDVIAITQLGSGSLAATDFPAALNNVTDTIFNANNFIPQVLANAANNIISSFISTPINIANAELEKLLRECYLQPNLENISSTENLVMKLGRVLYPGIESPSLETKAMIKQIAFALFMGQNAVSKLLTFLFMILGNNPDLLADIRDEMAKVTTPGKPLSPEEINALPLLDHTIKECLRLFPPVPIIVNEVKTAHVLADISITNSADAYQQAMLNRDQSHDIKLQVGDNIIISPFITQRLENYFESPLEFKPNRFNSRSTTLDDCSYLPFGAGARKCIGQSFALLETKLAVTALIQAFDFSVQEKLNHHTEFKYGGTIRPKFSVHGHFKPRETTLPPVAPLKSEHSMK